MPMESFATPYPVIFYDGVQEQDKGHVGIHSVLSFKKFQAHVSRLTGIPANQLSTVFVCRKTLKDAGKRQKLPINETTNFNIILNQHNPSKERDCYFLVSVKKSKKERKGSRKRNAEAENMEDDDSNSSSRGDSSPSGERPKSSFGESFRLEAGSPTSILERPLSPGEPFSPKQQNDTGMFSDGDVCGGLLVNPIQDQNLRSERVNEQIVGGIQSELNRLAEHNVNSQDRLKWEKQIAQESVIQTSKGSIDGEAQSTQFIQPYAETAYRERMAEYAKQSIVIPSQRTGVMAIASSESVPRQVYGINRSDNGAATGMHRNIAATGMLRNTGFQHGQVQREVVQVQPFRSYFCTAQEYRELGRGVNAEGNKKKFCSDCLVCTERNIRPPPFHWCINDTITSGFRGPSPAGPIERPVKRQLKAAA